MKIKLRYLKLSGMFINGKENKNKELEKLLFCKDTKILRQIMNYISNDLTTEQIKKFIEIRTFEKTFVDEKYMCVVKFIFSLYGDLVLEVVKFGKRDMYKEMKQQRIRNFDKGIFDDDIYF